MDFPQIVALLDILIAALQFDLSPAEIQRWELWMADPDNRASFDALCSLWTRTTFMEPMPRPDAQTLATDDYDGSEPFVEWSAAQSLHAPARSEDLDASDAPSTDHDATGFLARRPRRRAFAFAAAVAAVLATAGIFYAQITNQSQRYETHVAEHRTVNLPDGSEALLGAQTSLRVAYSRHRRTVVLDQGEVLIHVVPQPMRPFAVLAGSGVITAVGTSFAVKRNALTEHVTVTVTEGVVRIDPLSLAEATAPPSVVPMPPPIVAVLNEGKRVSYDKRGKLSAVRAVEFGSAAAWREGRLRYRDEPLREVVADVNRYSHREIILLDDSADSFRYTGTVFQPEIDNWIDGLPGIFDLEIVATDAERVLFRQSHPD